MQVQGSSALAPLSEPEALSTITVNDKPMALCGAKVADRLIMQPHTKPPLEQNILG